MEEISFVPEVPVRSRKSNIPLNYEMVLSLR
jgi:hypothetical protein